MKIMFTGTQGTGKTSLINELDTNLYKYTNGIRSLVKKYKLEHSENSNEKTQTKIFNNYKKYVKEHDDFISDRSLIDVFAHTAHLYKHFKVSEEYLLQQEKLLKNF